MKKAILIALALLVVALGVVIARNRPTADQEAIVYRQALMTVIGGTTDPLLLMQRGQIPYDAALIRKHVGELPVLSGMIPEAFARDTRSARHVDSAALPSIWSSHKNFLQSAQRLQSDANALQNAVKTADQAQIDSAIGTLTGGCNQCHRSFRQN